MKEQNYEHHTEMREIMKRWIHPDDPYQMNWVEGKKEWGTVKCPAGISVQIEQKAENDILTERYVFTNESSHDIFTSATDIAIYTPFNDNYEAAKVCMTNRCHTHIWCGKNVSYIMALRMGKEAPHLGLMLTKGSLEGYSAERDLEKSSNDRGDFLLHPEPFHLRPKESYLIEWILFWHNGKEDFYTKLREFENYIEVKADSYTVFKEELIQIQITPMNQMPIIVTDLSNGEKKSLEKEGNTYILREYANQTGERNYSIQAREIRTTCSILVMPKLLELVEKRCEFIARKQQYHATDREEPLDGAYLVYDTEEKHLYYQAQNDYNAARERVGMGILFAEYLKKTSNIELYDSLMQYKAYIEREIINPETGEVFNEIGRDASVQRLYNCPWIALFYIKLYELTKESENLTLAFRVLRTYYQKGGAKFYAIEIPAAEMIAYLEKEGRKEEKEELLGYLKEHAEFIIQTATNYPCHEVYYEQSIVAPAANFLFDIYEITKEERYLTEAEKQLEILELFNGLQPDYHLYEVSIRHWDGFWFGKYQIYGDTFPHYWSALTGNAYRKKAKIRNEKAYLKKADASYRGVLSLFQPDGSASCAMVYPITVNGIRAHFYDPYANDQDWGLYFILNAVQE